jgi:drug/metabolite transporter (DMT)-like permease
MSPALLGGASACGASALYNLGLALQALDARAAPAEHGLRLSLLRGLVRRPRWLAGTGLTILGWPLQTVALLLAPLAVVQPALAFGLVLLLLVGARNLGERVGRREVGAVGAILGGVVLLGIVAPEQTHRHAAAGTVAAVLGTLGIVAVAPYLARGRRTVASGLAAVSAGAALAWSGLSTQLVADALHGHAWVLLVAWAAATGLASGLGLLAEMTALQQRPATQVAPVVFTVQVVVPVLAAPLLTGEALGHSAFEVLGVVVGLAAVVGGAAALLRSPALSGFVEPGASSDESGTGPSPADASRSASAATAASVAPASAPAPAEATTMSPRVTDRPAGGEPPSPRRS